MNVVAYYRNTHNIFQSQNYQNDKEKNNIISNFEKDADSNNIEIDIEIKYEEIVED